MARDIRRQLDSAQNFSANAPVSFDLPRDNCYKEIGLYMSLNVTQTGAGATSGMFEHGPWTNLKRIELIADGKDVIKSYDGATLSDINWFDRGVFTPTEDASLAAAGDMGNMKFGLIMSLESVGMEFPQHTWLDARKLSSLEMRITWGAGIADIYGTATGGNTMTQSITPFGHEILDIDPKSTFSINQETMTQFGFPTTGATGRRFRLNVGNAYRRIIVSSKDQNARASVDRLTLTRLVENGIFNRRVWDMGWLKIHNALKKGVGGINLVASTINAHPTFPNITGVGAPTSGVAGGYRSGVYCIDIAEDGSENGLLDTAGYSDLSLEFDWVGALTTDLIRITPSIYVPAVR